MSESELTNAGRRLRLNEAIAGYLTAAEAGWTPDPEEFLARYPDLRPELALFLSDRTRLDRPTPPSRVETTSPDPAPGNEDPSRGITSDWAAVATRKRPPGSNPSTGTGSSLATSRASATSAITRWSASSGAGAWGWSTKPARSA